MANGFSAGTRPSGPRSMKSGTSGTAFPSFDRRLSCYTSRASARRRMRRTSPSSCRVSLANPVFGCGRHFGDTTLDIRGLRRSLATARDFGEPIPLGPFGLYARRVSTSGPLHMTIAAGSATRLGIEQSVYAAARRERAHDSAPARNIR
jgi:hypothetical protein